jgi:hypothetical protein
MTADEIPIQAMKDKSLDMTANMTMTVRVAIGRPGFPDTSDPTAHPSFDEQARPAPYASCAAAMSARASSCAARRTRSISL